MIRPIILLNEQAVEGTTEAEAIIAHELAHVARLDWAKLLISRVACALFWFNPLVWRLARECHQLREEAADDAVLLSEVDGADYASLLVNAARHDNKALLIAAHGVAPGKDSLKRRITRVLDADLARGPAGGPWTALCLIVLVGVAAPLAAFDPAARSVDLEGGAHRDGTVLLTSAAGTLKVGPDGTVLLTSRDGRTLTVRHGPNGQTLTTDGRIADGREKSKDDDRDRDDELDTIIASKAVGLTPDYIAAMRAAGFDGSVDDLTGARAVGVTPEFARQMRQYDPHVDLDTVIGARATGLSPAYFNQMRQIFPRLSLDDAVGMNAVGVTANFAQEMHGLFPRASADQIQAMAALGISPEYVRSMRTQGLPAGDPDAVIENRAAFPRGKRASAARPMPAAAQVAAARGVATANEVVRNIGPQPPAAPPAPPGDPRD